MAFRPMLGDKPTHQETIGGYTHRVWSDSTGTSAVEEYLIANMGHGIPLDAARDGYGNASAFMLDVGISSTRRIAASWGIAPAVKNSSRNYSSPIEVGQAVANESLKSSSRSRNETNHRQANGNGSWGGSKSPVGIRKVIEDALRTAGLMK